MTQTTIVFTDERNKLSKLAFIYWS